MMKSYKHLKNQPSSLLPAIALFFILYGGFIASCHYHEGGRIKAECPICWLQQCGNNAEIVDYNSTDQALQFAGKPVVNADELPLILVVFSNSYPHAPPSCS